MNYCADINGTKSDVFNFLLHYFIGPNVGVMKYGVVMHPACSTLERVKIITAPVIFLEGVDPGCMLVIYTPCCRVFLEVDQLDSYALLKSLLSY